MTPADIGFICELPYPLYKDFTIKQSEEHKKEKDRLDEQIKKQEQTKIQYENKLKKRFKV